MPDEDDMESAQRNVVSLSQYDKSRKGVSPGEALALLNECRDRLTAAIEHTWNDQRDAIELSLLSVGENSPILENRNWYYQAQGLLRQRNESLMSGLRNRIAARITALIEGHLAGETEALEDSGPSLSLVDDTAFEISLAVGKVASRVQADAVEELTALDQRIALLAQSLHARYGSNPFAPQALCEAFLDACAELDPNIKIRLILLQQFDASVVPVMPKIFQELNRFLAGRDILPSIKVGMDNRQTRAARARAPAPGVPGASAAGISTPGAGVTGGEEAGGEAPDVFVLLQQLLARQMMTGGGGYAPAPAGAGIGAISAGGGYASVGGGPGWAETGEAQPGMYASPISSLTQLQRGQWTGSMPANFDPARLQFGAVNVLREIRDVGLVRAENRTDEFVIDIVAMLFDYVFDEEQIPATLKALIGRLQIPMLKVAMLDRQFFSRKSHPARRLLDEMASASIGWTEEGEWNAALFAKMNSIVQTILNDFADDVTIFETLQQDLQRFLAEHEAQAQVTVAKTAQAIETVERSHLAETVAQDAIERTLADSTLIPGGMEVLPGLIVDFVRQTWRKVLMHSYTMDGERGADWQAAIKTMRDLLWSVTPKMGTEDRLALVAMLPELLRQLREGMNRIEVEPGQREVIFSALVACHSAAVKAGLQQTATVKPPEVDTVAFSSVLTEVSARPLPEVGAIEEVTGHFDFSAEPVDELADDTFTEQARGLKKGMWVEFDTPEGEHKSARLSWVSSLRGVYLFTNSQGLDAITITLPRLAARFRSGEARILKSGSFTERAVDRLIHRLQGTPRTA